MSYEPDNYDGGIDSNSIIYRTPYHPIPILPSIQNLQHERGLQVVDSGGRGIGMENQNRMLNSSSSSASAGYFEPQKSLQTISGGSETITHSSPNSIPFLKTQPYPTSSIPSSTFQHLPIQSISSSSSSSQSIANTFPQRLMNIPRRYDDDQGDVNRGMTLNRESQSVRMVDDFQPQSRYYYKNNSSSSSSSSSSQQHDVTRINHESSRNWNSESGMYQTSSTGLFNRIPTIQHPKSPQTLMVPNPNPNPNPTSNRRSNEVVDDSTTTHQYPSYSPPFNPIYQSTNKGNSNHISSDIPHSTSTSTSTSTSSYHHQHRYQDSHHLPIPNGYPSSSSSSSLATYVYRPYEEQPEQPEQHEQREQREQQRQQQQQDVQQSSSRFQPPYSDTHLPTTQNTPIAPLRPVTSSIQITEENDRHLVNENSNQEKRNTMDLEIMKRNEIEEETMSTTAAAIKIKEKMKQDEKMNNDEKLNRRNRRVVQKVHHVDVTKEQPVSSLQRTPSLQRKRLVSPAILQSQTDVVPRINTPRQESSEPLEKVHYDLNVLHPTVLQPSAQQRRGATEQLSSQMSRQESSGERDRLEATDALIALSVASTVLEPSGVSQEVVKVTEKKPSEAESLGAEPSISASTSEVQLCPPASVPLMEPPSPSLPSHPIIIVDDDHLDDHHDEHDDNHNDLDGDEEEEHDYETQRRIQIADNERLLTLLGLGGNSGRSLDDVQERKRGRPPGATDIRPRQSRRRRTQYAWDGTTRDLPTGKDRQRIAFVDILLPKSRRRLDMFKYTHMPPVPETPRDPPRVESFMEAVSEAPEMQITAKGWGIGDYESYGDIPGEPCHQCRRRSDLPKMKCRSKDPICGRFFCISCVRVRYNIAFDEDDRTFICPKCEGYCNCSVCLKRNGLLNNIGNFSVAEAKKGGSVQAYLESMGAQPVIPPERQIHAVRFVKRKEDLQSPAIPPEVITRLNRARHYAKRRPNKPKTSKQSNDVVTPGNVDLPTVRNRKKSAKASEAWDNVTDDTHSPSQSKKRRTTLLLDGDRGVPRKKRRDGGPKAAGIPVMDVSVVAAEVNERLRMVDSDGDTIPGMDDDDDDDRRTSFTMGAAQVLYAFADGLPLDFEYVESNQAGDGGYGGDGTNEALDDGRYGTYATYGLTLGQ